MAIYVVDTSAFIQAKENYPPANFSEFWDVLHQMNIEGKVIILKKVKTELEEGNDYLSTEFLNKKVITECEDNETISYLSNITKVLEKNHLVGFQSWLKDADPYVVAYCLRISKLYDEKVILIHGEVRRGKKIRIPFVCRKLSLDNGKMSRLIIEEELNFGIIK